MISDNFQIGPNGAYEHVGNNLDKQYNEVLIIAINLQVIEFNEHFCILKYDDDRKLKIYSFEQDYKIIKEYYEQPR